MKAFLALLLLAGFAYCNAVHEESDIEREQEEWQKKTASKESDFAGFITKAFDYFLKNPNTRLERECFAKLKPGQTIDFVIDLAPSPSKDPVDRRLAEESPISLFVKDVYRKASHLYFASIQTFIEAVTIDMKPELTKTIIYDNGNKYFIRGRHIDDVEAVEKLKLGGEFEDVQRNLKTLWPVSTKEEVISCLGPLVKNNLGRMTKLALSNRNNGLSSVLSSSRRSKPVYTVIISDGSSGARINDLTEDLSRTIVIDIGDRRFAKNLSGDELKQLSGVYTLTAPQKLSLLVETTRYVACRQVERAETSF